MDSLDLHPEARPRARARRLLDRPQRVGILPTLWFWNDRANYRHARGFTVTAFTVAYAMVLAIEPGPVLAGVACGFAPYLSLGVLERVVRRRARGRDDAQRVPFPYNHPACTRLDPSRSSPRSASA